jgi:serine/threonine protein kinase
MLLIAGTKLGPYEIVEPLGAGGMGEVYRAHDERLDRDVALKVLPAGVLADEIARKRFRKEALALAKLCHPNICMIFDFDIQDGVDFLAMEYVAGQSLAQKVNAASLPEKEVVTLGAQLAAALEEAHEQRIVHCDLKPGNILVTPKGQAKVLDFGLAKLLRAHGDPGATQTFTETQGVAGTLTYMAPEQLRGEGLDVRTDIYALGCVLYEMATGRRAFPENSVPRLTDTILHQAPVGPRAVNGRVSAQLEAITLKCLEKEAEHRYQSAKEASVDLRRLAFPTAASGVRPARISLRKIGIGAAAGFVAILLLLVALNVAGLRERSLGKSRGIPEIRSLAVLAAREPLRRSGAGVLHRWNDGSVDCAAIRD